MDDCAVRSEPSLSAHRPFDAIFMRSGAALLHGGFYELCCYTLAHGDPTFLHQHVVDAFAAQSTRSGDRPIRLAFALIGLYLHVEKRLSGKQVQRAHMSLARRKRPWPAFALPEDRGAITAAHVLAVAPGPDRDRRIEEWCDCVWRAFRESRSLVIDLHAEHGIA